jgi:transcriptional regulator with XRE-family HTH domain
MPRGTRTQAPPIKDFIKEWRKALGISQNELARRMGREQSDISYIERGIKRWTPDFLADAAAALEVSPADLIAYDPRDPESPYQVIPYLAQMNSRLRLIAIESIKAMAAGMAASVDMRTDDPIGHNDEQEERVSPPPDRRRKGRVQQVA